MLIAYSPDYSLSFSIGGSHSGAAFIAPSDGSNLADARTGSVNSFSWIGGTQNTSSYVEITVTITSAIDSTKQIGAVGICNCSLPAGTKITVQGIDQRLVADSRGQRNAWFVPLTTGSSFTVRIWNDVNGVASIVAGAEESIGEIFVGRVMNLNTLSGSNPNRQLQDPTAVQRSSGGQLWALMRKAVWQIGATFGRFTTAQAKGGSAASDISDGAGGTIDIQTLQMMLSQSRVFAVCDTEDAGRGSGTDHGALNYDQDFMQTNWMLARLFSAGQIQMDQRPYWTWNPQFVEAT
jgi:hypothetical protein